MASKASPRTLVIVESPTKATKIGSYLGDDYIVESSRGHIRDLPTSASDVPAKYKGEKWARTGVNVNNDFEPIYVVPADKKSTMRELRNALAESDELLLATDGDREGGGDRLAPAAGTEAEGAGEADGLPRDHPAGDPAGRGEPARTRYRPGRCPGDPANPGPALRLRGLPRCCGAR